MKHHPLQSTKEEMEFKIKVRPSYLTEKKTSDLIWTLYCLRQDHLFFLLYSTTKYQSN